MTVNEKYNLWLSKCDGALLEELKAMSEERKADAFYKDVEFGTAGLRSDIGAGTNCMNIYTVGRATKGFADYLLEHNKKPKVAICYDSRHMSKEFTDHAAAILAANGIEVYVSDGINPTPYLSFMVRHFKCDGGIMITASHNPAKYNGYKVYGPDGCQCTDESAGEIYNKIQHVDYFSVEADGKSPLIHTINIEDEYLACVDGSSVCGMKPIKVVYTPLNGAGYRLVPRCLKAHGVTELYEVKEQNYPNGDFATCAYPNPERRETMQLGIDLAAEKGADIVIGTDPDCDRMGVAVRTRSGEYKLITGNEMGVLFTDFIFTHKEKLPKNPVLVKTIVSTDLASRVAESYGGTAVEVLTGFKYIGEVIKKLEAKGEGDRFVLGFEESYGYLPGTYVRDKDAVIASLMAAEMASNYLAEGKTLDEKLEEIYAKFGRYIHKTVSFTFEGSAGAEHMKELLAFIRKNPISTIDGEPVTEYVDYLNQTKLDLPKANVLSYKTESGNGVIIRPSGTEPLIKAYITVAVGGESKVEAILSEVAALLK